MRMDIHTKSPALIVVNNDTMQTSNEVASFMVTRSKKPLPVVSIVDTISKIYMIKSQISPVFLSNLLLGYAGIPGLIIDAHSNKAYSYPEHIFINPAESKTKYSKFGNYNHKGEFYLNFSIPELNILKQYTHYAGYVNKAGCLGISGGLDYYHKPLQFVNLSGAIALTFEAPIPLPLEYFGPHNNAHTKYISISNNHRYYFLSYGYGLSFSQNVWNYYGEMNFDNFGSMEIHKKSFAIGFVFPLYLKLGKTFNLGFIYRPSFYRPYSPQPFKYEHLISVDLAWKFLINR